MRLTLLTLIFGVILLVGCDISTRYAHHTNTTIEDGMKMTVITAIKNESTVIDCKESDSGVCFFKVASRRCFLDAGRETCITIDLEDFKLAQGETKTFVGKDNNEDFVHCASATEFEVGYVCEPKS
ncbi:MAG: hypothetical protein ACPGR2_04420 [Psychrobium sp.]